MYQANHERLVETARQYDLNLIVVFGSQVRGQERPGSDIDVAVRMTSRDWGDAEQELMLIGELAEAIQGDGDIDVVFLNGASPLLLFEVASSGKALYQKEPTTFMQFQSYAARRYDDSRKFFPLQDCFIEEHIERWKKHKSA